MIKRDNSAFLALEYLSYKQPIKYIKGLISSHIAYPLSERMEKRDVSSKVRELKRYYSLSVESRNNLAKKKLYEIVKFSSECVPYYKDLFNDIKFNPENIRKDVKYIKDIPFLTKDIIRQQGNRLLSSDLSTVRHYDCKTGGSTGLSCHIFYDQNAADFSSAVTLYTRDRIGNKKNKSELHFACRFPSDPIPTWPSREDFKCFAMNRSNIFFDRLDSKGLAEIWATLKHRGPHLIHAHPSTIYALACYIKAEYGKDNSFKIFESSGELLEPYMRRAIEDALTCKVINRYGLAEFGVMAYEVDSNEKLYVLDSEGLAENLVHPDGGKELVFTGYRNKLMPLIRYATGDLAKVEKDPKGVILTDIVGRIHDMVPINGVIHPTHHIQDILDHRVGSIQEFQIDLRMEKPVLRIVLETNTDGAVIIDRIEQFWPNAFDVQFVGHEDFIRVGHRAKFRHVVTQ
jgi:phenylacetate-CoA ligase